MASFTIFKSLFQIFILAIISLFFNNCNLAEADHDLMKSECENTEVPELCMQCLESDPKSEKADMVGIATVVVNCMIEDSHTTVSNFTDVAKNTTDEHLKAAAEGCIKYYSNVIGHLSTANIHLKKREYDMANDAITAAIDYEQKCHGEIKSFKEILYSKNPSIFYDMKALEDLSEAAMRIIDRFE